jgi:hypothetical protein
MGERDGRLVSVGGVTIGDNEGAGRSVELDKLLKWCEDQAAARP